jgi:hypothetical protein
MTFLDSPVWSQDKHFLARAPDPDSLVRGSELDSITCCADRPALCDFIGLERLSLPQATGRTTEAVRRSDR